MKQKAKQKKAGASKSILMIMVASFIIGTGCKNDDKTKDAGTKSESIPKETTTESANVARLYELSGFLHTVKMSKAQYNDTVKTPGAIKFVLQFYFDTTKPKSPSLIAYASKQNNKFFKTSDKIPDTLFADQPTLDIEQKMIFGDNEITFKELNKYIRDNTAGGVYTYIVFTPKINSANKHIFYRITLEGTTAAAVVGTLDTNPSPPKDAD